MSAVRFLMRPRTRGEHVHVQVFAGTNAGSRGLCGELVMRREEWDVLSGMLTVHGHSVDIDDATPGDAS